MRKFVSIVLAGMIIMASVLVVSKKLYAADAGEAIKTIQENPGKSAGVAGCGVVIAFFPPAAIWCAVSVLSGVAVDEVD